MTKTKEKYQEVASVLYAIVDTVKTSEQTEKVSTSLEELLASDGLSQCKTDEELQGAKQVLVWILNAVNWKGEEAAEGSNPMVDPDSPFPINPVMHQYDQPHT